MSVFEEGCYLVEVKPANMVYLILAFNRPEKFRRKPCPIVFTPQAVRTPYGTIVRVLVKILDDPSNPLRCETFLNPLNPKDKELYEKLLKQNKLPIVIKVAGRYVDSLAMTFSERSVNALKSAWQTAVKCNEEEGVKQIDMMKAKDYVMKTIKF